MQSKIPNNPNKDLNFDTTKLKEIWLAGGCFWGVEAYMARVYGVYDVTSGYANGYTENPTYEEVCTHKTGHSEAVHVKYDPNRVSLETLLEYYFRVIDPTVKNRQGNDIGPQYRTAIYYKDEEDKVIIENRIIKEQEKYSQKIVTEVELLKQYYLAEEYHQDYLEKNPNGYCHIDFGKLQSFNKPIIDIKKYPKPDEQVLKERLTDLQFRVTQSNVTERPFSNEYWDYNEKGIYVDIVTGEPLFLSSDKYESGCGWPSFTKPITDEVLNYLKDTSHFMTRTEVRSRSGDSHLGHVFDDGPKELGGKRYCINSASLRFIPYNEMEKEGYGYLLNQVR